MADRPDGRQSSGGARGRFHSSSSSSSLPHFIFPTRARSARPVPSRRVPSRAAMKRLRCPPGPRRKCRECRDPQPAAERPRLPRERDCDGSGARVASRAPRPSPPRSDSKSAPCRQSLSRTPGISRSLPVLRRIDRPAEPSGTLEHPREVIKSFCLPSQAHAEQAQLERRITPWIGGDDRNQQLLRCLVSTSRDQDPRAHGRGRRIIRGP